MLPLFYHQREAERSSWTLFPILFRSRSDDGNFGSWTLLPLFHREADDRDDSSLTVAPLIYRNRRGGLFNTTLIGPFLWRNATQREETDFALLPLIYYSTEYFDYAGLHRTSFRFFPILGWRRGDQAERGREDFLFWSLLGYYSRQETRGQRERRTIATPLFYSSITPNDSTLLMPLLYWHDRRSGPDSEKQRFILLHYAEWSERQQKHSWSASATIQANPLFYYSDRIEREGTQLDYRTVWFAPLLPLVYRRVDSERGNSTSALLWHWQTESDGDLRRFWFLPLFYYAPDRYLYAIPFFIQPDASAKRRLHFSIAHYYTRDEESSFLWALLYYDFNAPAQARSYSGLAPLYYQWESPDSSGELFLPFRFRYQDRSRYFSLYAVGLAFDQQISVRSDNASEYNYDQDVSLLYNLLRFSWRRTFRKPGETAPASQDAPPAPALFEEPDFSAADSAPSAPSAPRRPSAFRGENGGGVELSDSPEFTRESSRDFFGFTALFGLIAYERADSQRSFRTAPLWWFTWNESNEDQVSFLLGAYFSYREKDLEYFALTPAFLPLYGRQRRGASFFEAYLAIAYWKEYDAAEDRREGTVLWPLINWHRSTAASGSRALPFYYFRRERAPDGESSFFWSPLFWRKHSPEGGWNALLPVYYYNWTKDPNRDSYSAWLLAPGFYWSYANQETHWNALLLADYRGAQDTGRFTLFPVFSRRSGRDSNFWLLPFYYSSNDGQTEHFLAPLYHYESEERPGAAEKRSALLTPLFYTTRVQTEYGTERTTIAPLLYYERFAPAAPDADGGAESVFFFPGLYWNYDQSESHWNALILADYQARHQGDSVDYTRFLLFPLVGGRSGPDGWAYLIPFYYGWNRSEDETALHLLPVIWSWRSQQDLTLFLAGLYIRERPGYSRQNFLYLFDRIRQERSLEWSAALGLISYEGDDYSSDFRLGYGLIFGVQNDPYRFQGNLLWWREVFAEDRRLSSFFPLWHYDRSGADLDWYFLPALSGGAYEPGQGWTALALGALYYRGYDDRVADSTTHLLLGAAYLQLERGSEHYRSRGSLWGVLWNYEEESDTDFRKFSILKILYSHTFYQGRNSYRFLGIRFAGD